MYPEKRYCEVKTFFGPPGIVDRHIPQVQWLNTDSNPEGDESTSVPRVGSTGLVFFVEGVAFMWGYFKAEDPDEGAITGNEPEDITEGDKVIASIGGNRISIKSNGSIEIRSKDNLRTIYFPKKSILTHLCSIHELQAAGGSQKWDKDDLGLTVHKAEFRRDILRTIVLQEEKGSVDSTIVKRTVMGPPTPSTPDVDLPLYTYELDVTGKEVRNYGLTGTGMNFETDPLGAYEFYNLVAKMKLSLEGQWTINNLAATWDISPEGDFRFENLVSESTISATGDFAIKNPTSEATLSATGDLDFKNPIVEASIQKTGDISLKNAMNL